MIRRWRPLNELSRGKGKWIRFSMNCGEDSAQGPGRASVWQFPVDVLDQGDEIIVRAELPGVEKDKSTCGVRKIR